MVLRALDAVEWFIHYAHSEFRLPFSQSTLHYFILFSAIARALAIRIFLPLPAQFSFFVIITENCFRNFHNQALHTADSAKRSGRQSTHLPGKSVQKSCLPAPAGAHQGYEPA
jgi:hypothetical protein